MNKQKQQEQSSGGRLRIVSAAELMLIREQLEQVSRPGTDPLRQAAVITWAMQFKGAYYQARTGGLRRVFPKATEVVLFNGVPQTKSGQALLASGEQDATN